MGSDEQTTTVGAATEIASDGRDADRLQDGPVYRYLDLSTAHLPEHEMARLSAGVGASIIPHEYGAMVRVPPADEEADEPAYPDLPALMAVLAHARALGCSFVNFDCDAAEIDGLARFDW